MTEERILELAMAFKALISVTKTGPDDDVRLVVYEPGPGGNTRFEFFMDVEDNNSVVLTETRPGDKTKFEVGDIMPEHQAGRYVL